jgi:polysaccharide chain length determinant protein (PEP-CTERM system associated)
MQPMQDLLSIPRRPLDVEDYIDILRRHKSWILGPAFACLVASVVVAFMWTDTYLSEATVQVVAPQVPEKYVPSNVNSEMSSRINQMAQTVQSRANLINIIQSNNLYRGNLQRKPLEDVIEDMRKDIRISPVVNLQQSGREPISAFRVSFEYSNRMLAQKVTQELVRGFIDENIRALSSQSTATTEFLKDQWEAAKKSLDELENRTTQFRLKNAGRLPDELQANLATLRTLEQQLAGSNEAVSRIGQEKLLLESQLRVYKEQYDSLTQGGSDHQVSVAAKSERLAQLERDIVGAETLVSTLRERYKETHPDVKAAEAQLSALRKRRDALLKVEQDSAPQPAAPRKVNVANIRGARELEVNIAAVQSQIQSKDMELEERTKAQKQILALVNQYNDRIQASPLMEREYAQLTRDYGLAKVRYDELNAKKAQSEIATSLENRGQGERLQLLDPASLPERPVKPNRPIIIAAGAAIGLLLGIFIAGAREMKDSSLKNLKDARAYTNLPVLGTVPLLENDLVVRRKRRLVWAAWSAACVCGVLLMAGSVYYYYITRV